MVLGETSSCFAISLFERPCASSVSTSNSRSLTPSVSRTFSVGFERRGRRPAEQSRAHPDTQPQEGEGDEHQVGFGGVRADDELKLQPLQAEGAGGEQHAIYKNGPDHALGLLLGVDSTRGGVLLRAPVRFAPDARAVPSLRLAQGVHV